MPDLEMFSAHVTLQNGKEKDSDQYRRWWESIDLNFQT